MALCIAIKGRKKLLLLGVWGDSLNLEEYGIEIKQVDQVDDGILAHWEATADNIDLFGIAAVNEDLPEYQWSVCVNAAEFICDEPLESKFRSRIAEAIRAVKGVNKLEEADREVWIVDGTLNGRELLEAIVKVLVELKPEIVTYLSAH